EAEVITVVGDGSYIFGVPSSAYWAADTYQTPHLTVILNSKGWNAPKRSTLLVHPQGTANRRDRFWTTIGARARLADIAGAAGDIAAFQVTRSADLDATLREAMQVVREGRSAVVDV